MEEKQTRNRQNMGKLKKTNKGKKMRRENQESETKKYETKKERKITGREEEYDEKMKLGEKQGW